MECISIPLLAVDGGGTKCLAVFVDRHKKILGTGRAGACNYQGIGTEAAVAELISGMKAALAEVKQAEGFWQAVIVEVECAVFGLAGLDTEHDRGVIIEMVKVALDKLNIQVKHLLVENDGLAVLLGATNGESGVLVIAGTGSIAYGINKQGVSARAGGWGHRVGDEGSGFWIGKQAITSILQALDGRGETTSLSKLILPHLGLRHAEELFNWMYGAQYSVEKVGELSRFVSMAVVEGDEVAKQIVTAASAELFASARAVIDRLGMRNERFKIILQGGVLQNDPLIRQMVTEKFRTYTPHAQLDTAKHEAIHGVIDKGLAFLRTQSDTSI